MDFFGLLAMETQSFAALKYWRWSLEQLHCENVFLYIPEAMLGLMLIGHIVFSLQKLHFFVLLLEAV